jgi:hypothetical protein
VIHAGQLDKADEIVVGLVLVGDQERLRINMLCDGRPGVLAVLVFFLAPVLALLLLFALRSTPPTYLPSICTVP